MWLCASRDASTYMNLDIKTESLHQLMYFHILKNNLVWNNKNFQKKSIIYREFVRRVN
jgi:hypothetical protein